MLGDDLGKHSKLLWQSQGSLSLLRGAMFWGAKNAQVLKCLLPFIIAAFHTETLSQRAINRGVWDVGRIGTWCHRSGPLGPFGSALESGVGGSYLLPASFSLKDSSPADDWSLKAFMCQMREAPPFLVAAKRGAEKEMYPRSGEERWGEMSL